MLRTLANHCDTTSGDCCFHILVTQALAASRRCFSKDLQNRLQDIGVKFRSAAAGLSWRETSVNLWMICRSCCQKRDSFGHSQKMWSNVPVWVPQKHKELCPGNIDASTDGVLYQRVRILNVISWYLLHKDDLCAKKRIRFFWSSVNVTLRSLSHFLKYGGSCWDVFASKIL